MQKDKKFIIKFGCLTVVLLLFSLWFLASLMEDKESRERYEEFYEQNQNIDVLLLGTSHMFCAVSPMDMWEQNGIVSYNLATSGCRIPSSYWILKNALEYTKPEVVVLDCAYLLDEKAHKNIGYMHKIFDAMPLSRTKLMAIKDLMGEEKRAKEILFPFSTYHNRWENLEKDDWCYTPAYGKMGFVPSYSVVEAQLENLVSDDINILSNASIDYLDKIVQLCKSESIELLLTFLPFQVNEISRNDAAFIQVIAERYQLKYLNPNILLDIIDMKTDFKDNDDNNSHLNISGAHKMSYYIGDYLAKNYNILDRRQDSDYQEWHDIYETYSELKLSLLKEQKKLDSYLVGTADRNYICIVQMKQGGEVKNEMIINLLNNIGIDIRNKSEMVNSIKNEDLFVTFYPREINVKQLSSSVWGKNDSYYEIISKDADIYTILIHKDSKEILDISAFRLDSLEKVY